MKLKLKIQGGVNQHYTWRFTDGVCLVAQSSPYVEIADLRRSLVRFLVAVQGDDFDVEDETHGALLSLKNDRKLNVEVNRAWVRRAAAKKAAATRKGRVYASK